jgi:cyclase
MGLVVLAGAVAACSHPAQTTADIRGITSAPRADSGFTVRKLADGIYAAVRNEPQGFINESNSLFIIGDRDVIVVDAQSSSTRTRETLAALRQVTTKPVRTLIHTHWHDDHVVGSEVYRDAFPGLEIIGHSANAEDMATMGVQFRKGVAGRAGTIDYLRGLAQKHQSFLGGPSDAEEDRSHMLSAWLTDEYSNASPDFRPLTPTRTVADSLILSQGKRRIEVRFLGKGHTRGDLVVYLPGEGILATGDLLMWPVQFIGSTSFPQDFLGTEQRLRDLKPRFVLPGHGKVLSKREADDQSAIILKTLHALVDQADSAVAHGETLEQAAKHLDLAEPRREMAGTSRLRQGLFSYYVADAGFKRAFEIATERHHR